MGKQLYSIDTEEALVSSLLLDPNSVFEALGISLMWVVLVVPLFILVIFFHILAKLIESWVDPPPAKT